MTPIDWNRVAAHPGDIIGAVAMRRSDDVGIVCAQHYGTFVRIASFLPGRTADLPGDTPKIEPERYKHFHHEDRTGAEEQFDAFLRDAQDAGWVIPLSTGAERVATDA